MIDREFSKLLSIAFERIFAVYFISRRYKDELL